MALIRKDNHVLYAGWDVDVISSDGTVQVQEYEPNKFDLSVGEALEGKQDKLVPGDGISLDSDGDSFSSRRSLSSAIQFDIYRWFV